MLFFSRLLKRLRDTLVGHDRQHHFLSGRRYLRFLTGFLIISIVLLVLFFPLLFLYVESGWTSAEFEEATEDSTLVYSFASALYWSVVTPISLNLDGWPQTVSGRLLVRLSDMTKLLALFVVALRFYDSVSTRLIKKSVRPARSNRENGDRRREMRVALDRDRDDLTTKSRKELGRFLTRFVRKDPGDPTDWNGH